MRKIFITGFQHSGTTLLHQLIKAHPKVGWIENEENYIEFDKGKDWILKMASKRVSDMKEYAWGEKIPWIDDNGTRIINLMKLWCKYFKTKTRIIHILRHPIDTSNSISPKLWDQLDYILKSLPNVIDYLNENKRASTILYEDLLLFPEKSLTNIFNFLDLEVNDKIIKNIINTDLKFGKINSERAYAHRRLKPIQERINEVDYEKIIERIKIRL